MKYLRRIAMNKVILMGRLTANPEYQQTQSGIAVCRFQLAVNRPTQNGKEQESDFFRCTAWRGTADFVSKFFTKGKPILVEGSIRNNTYTDQNGVTHYNVDIQADKVSFCLTDSGRNNSGEYQNGYINNNYNQGGYAPQGNNNYYQQPQQQSAMPYQQPVNNVPVQAPTLAPNTSTKTQDLQAGQLDDFEEILNDGEIPF